MAKCNKKAVLSQGNRAMTRVIYHTTISYGNCGRSPWSRTVLLWAITL